MELTLPWLVDGFKAHRTDVDPGIIASLGFNSLNDLDVYYRPLKWYLHTFYKNRQLLVFELGPLNKSSRWRHNYCIAFVAGEIDMIRYMATDLVSNAIVSLYDLSDRELDRCQFLTVPERVLTARLLSGREHDLKRLVDRSVSKDRINSALIKLVQSDIKIAKVEKLFNQLELDRNYISLYDIWVCECLLAQNALQNCSTIEHKIFNILTGNYSTLHRQKMNGYLRYCK